MDLKSDSFQAALRHLLLPSQGVLALLLTNQLAAASSLYANEYHRASQGDEAVSSDLSNRCRFNLPGGVRRCGIERWALFARRNNCHSRGEVADNQ